jgi:hypothetical protein
LWQAGSKEINRIENNEVENIKMKGKIKTSKPLARLTRKDKLLKSEI